MFPNHHSFLTSVTHHYPEDPYDDTLAQISTNETSSYIMTRSVNSGSFSYHSGRAFTSSRYLAAGDELFINYPPRFLDAHPSLDLVPRRQDYFVAASIVSSTLDSFNIHFLSPLSLDSIQSRNSTLIESMLLVMREKLSQITENVQRKAILVPTTKEELFRVLNTAAKIDSVQSTPYTLEMALAQELSVKKRSVEWIVENGYCLDNIISNKSTIPGVGRGAFARRRILKNSIIVHTPMLHIIHKDELRLHRVQVDGKGHLKRNKNVMTGMQLLYNYCMGHRQSNFLLCPTTNSMLINHCKKKDEHCGGPNAFVNWSDDESTNEWRRLSLDEIAQV